MFQPVTNKQTRLATSLALFFIYAVVLSQQPYFQQEVNYTLTVKLDDERHALRANATIAYINNSPETMRSIYFHLWPNAYRNSHTGLGRQLLAQGNAELFFSGREEKGFIDSLDFKSGGATLNWQFDKANPDMCQVNLISPLLPGDTVIISTPFFVKIPDAKFSRLGHNGQAYYITQWYPKPAVFDRDGWHAMPYLDQGEFYSEFGSFDVSITLPKNYVLAATGNRVDAAAEEQMLLDREADTRRKVMEGFDNSNDAEFPPSDKEYKTVRFRQQRVHDFAWFADKRFEVMQDEVTLPASGRKVKTWVFFTDKNAGIWKNAIRYVNAAMLFYSRLCGDYPYDQVTAVDGTIMAGDGMEYPNITVIGDVSSAYELDITIAHEVGHNWFYGILGSNERDHAFLDEGINSFYELRYAREKYRNKKLGAHFGLDSSSRLFGLNRLPAWKEKELSYFLAKRSGTDQPIDLPSTDFSRINYGSIVYGKTAVVLDYLMDAMGEPQFDAAMRNYFSQFSFKHPGPDDFFSNLGKYGDLDIEAVKRDLFNSTRALDYCVKKIKHVKGKGFELTVKNKTGVAMPFNVSAFNKGRLTKQVWYEGFRGTKVLEIPEQEAERFQLDGEDKMPDINRRNNRIKTKGLFKKAKPLQLNFIAQMEDPAKTQVNYLPIAGYNEYNGFMTGLAIHNYGILPRRFEYLLAPMFGFKTLTPVGSAKLDLNLFPGGALRQLVIGVRVKSFAYDNFDMSRLNTANHTNFKSPVFSYVKVAPYLDFRFRNRSAGKSIQQSLLLTANILITDSLNSSGSSLQNLAVQGATRKTTTTLVNEATYLFQHRRAVDPFAVRISAQQAGTMARLSASFDCSITISKTNYFEIGFFGGIFLSGNEGDRAYYAFRPSGYSGYQDYLFDGNYLGRNDHTGLAFSQFMEKDGNLKTWTVLGRSPNRMASVNIKSPKFFILPLRAFADVMFCDPYAIKNETLLWDAGLDLSIWEDVMDVYIPMLYSPYIKEKLDLNNIGFYNRIRFTFNIHKLVPKNFITNNLQ